MPANSIDDGKICDEPRTGGLQPLPRGVSAGRFVQVRGRRARLDLVVSHEDCSELWLSHDETAGPRQVLLWPFDRPRPFDSSPRLRIVKPSAWLRDVRRVLATELDPLTPRARAGDVSVVAYQLSPVLAVLRGESRLLLSDEVGLGKTIQAGWIVAEILARDPGARVLLAVPASVRRQWIGELERRFDLAAVEADAKWMRTTISDLPADVSPWTAPGIYVTSIDFLKRPDVVASALPHIWDALIVDEAHGATTPTDRHAALARLAQRARRVVLITATPYSGDETAFSSMTALGAVDGSAAPLVFRRCRSDVGDVRTRRHRFASVRLTPAEVRLQRLLEEYSRAVWNSAVDDVGSARLAVTILRKRALSSATAAAASLRRRRELLIRRTPLPRQLALFDDGEDIGDEAPSAALGAPGLADADAEQRWLDTLIDAADCARARDSKLAWLLRLLRRTPRESAVVFTEYRDTLRYLAAALPPSIELHGGLAATERGAAQQRFNREGGLLLATDAAAEGLNLQGRCRLVVNYELPWNPARLEQRIGRVDRIGQERTVHALTITARDTAEDLVLANLARRLSRVVATFGADDRLGAFLDESRVARMVMDDLLPAPSDAAPPDSIRLAVAPGDAEDGAAARLRARAGQARQDVAGHDVLIASVRAASLVPAGFIVIIGSTLQRRDGFVVGRRFDALHVEAAVRKPARHAEARSAVQALFAKIGDRLLASLPAVEAWSTEMNGAHRAAVDRTLARERALLERPVAHAAVQPGLFDRRELEAADARTRVDLALSNEVRQRIERLEGSRSLERCSTPVAVLLVWR